MNLKNGTPVLFVKDAKKAKDFYADILGMTVTSDFGGLNYMFKEGLALWQIMEENIISRTLGCEHIYNPESVSRLPSVFMIRMDTFMTPGLLSQFLSKN